MNSLILISSISLQVQASVWNEAWTIDGLPNPESVVYDSERDVIYVSHLDSNGPEGNASIGRLSLTGEVIEKEWVKGLNEPKGIALLNDHLFVSDVTELVEIDIESSQIVRRYPAAGARFLNDVATDSDGQIYVSDMFNSSIYRLSTNGRTSGQLRLWAQNPSLQNPNGLLIQGGNLLIAAWGSFNNENPMSATQGSLLQISLSNREVSVLSHSPIGNLDGLQVFRNGKFLLSDWVTGDIFEYQNGVATRVLDLERSAGDIAYLEEQNLLLVPMAIQGKVIAFQPQ